MNIEERETAVMTRPWWEGDVLVSNCLHCFTHPGSEHKDGSGVCRACLGVGFKVLARRQADEKEGENG